MQLPFLPNAKMHVMGAESGPLARPGLALNLMPRFIFLPIAFLSRAKFLFETSAYSASFSYVGEQDHDVPACMGHALHAAGAAGDSVPAPSLPFCLPRSAWYL